MRLAFALLKDPQVPSLAVSAMKAWRKGMFSTESDVPFYRINRAHHVMPPFLGESAGLVVPPLKRGLLMPCACPPRTKLHANRHE